MVFSGGLSWIQASPGRKPIKGCKDAKLRWKLIFHYKIELNILWVAQSKCRSKLEENLWQNMKTDFSQMLVIQFDWTISQRKKSNHMPHSIDSWEQNENTHHIFQQYYEKKKTIKINQFWFDYSKKSLTCIIFLLFFSNMHYYVLIYHLNLIKIPVCGCSVTNCNLTMNTSAKHCVQFQILALCILPLYELLMIRKQYVGA